MTLTTKSGGRDPRDPAARNPAERSPTASTGGGMRRRDALRSLGAMAAAAAGGSILAACASSGKAGALATTTGAAGKGTIPGATVPWASGGTKAMRATYEDPFAAARASGKASGTPLTCEMTLGPCHARSLVRRDISEGQAGLPMRMMFLVTTEDGATVSGAEVDVWHASPRGIYSAEDAAAMCTNNDPEALKARYFRGLQTTDDAGRVSFDSCLPGYYRGRAVHVHFTVRVGGEERVTAQLGFDDGFLDAVYATEPLYADRPARDTRNTTDGILGGSLAVALFDVKRMDDGVLLASKHIVIRKSNAETACQAPSDGPGGPGGPGGPPPGGPGGPPPGGFRGPPPGSSAAPAGAK